MKYKDNVTNKSNRARAQRLVGRDDGGAVNKYRIQEGFDASRQLKMGKEYAPLQVGLDKMADRIRGASGQRNGGAISRSKKK